MPASFLFSVLLSCNLRLPWSLPELQPSGGTAGTVGATYASNNVGTTGGITIRAVIEMVAVTGGAVLQNIDASTGGSANAWQPVINGSQTIGNCFGMEFIIRFFNAATSAPLTLSSFRANGVDTE